jgi:hypothetical protein
VAEESASPKNFGTKFIWVVVGGLVSLAVGVIGGITVNRLSVPQPGLEYDLVTSAQFAGETEKIAIVALTISNPANKEVEDVTSSLDLHNLKLNETKVVGLRTDSYSKSIKDGVVLITVPFLNPKESFSVQLLLSSPTPEIPKLDVVVRGKGVTGLPRATTGENSDQNILLALVVSSTGAILAVFSMFYIMVSLRRRLLGRTPSKYFSKRHHDDQRDVTAFVFFANGFNEEAQWARNSERELSYWGEADRLTDKVLEPGAPESIRSAIKCLQELLSYANIADTSELYQPP